MNNTISNILGIAAILALGVLAFCVLMFYSLEKTKIENEARTQCATISRYEVTKEGTKVFYPVTDVYEKCLLEKGIR